MKKLPRYLVSLAVAVFVLGGGALLALNLYVQSRAVQLRIRQGLSDRLRMPVTLRKTTFSPWDGLRIDSVAARARSDVKKNDEDAAAANATFLTAESFRVKFDWGALLHRRFVVEDVLLDQPRLSWAQDKTNRWHLPANRKDNADQAAETPSTSATPSPSGPASATVPGTEAVLSSPGASPHQVPPVSTTSRSDSLVAHSAPGKIISLEKFRLRHGNLDFLNYRRGLLGRFEEVNLDGHLSDPRHSHGHASVTTATLPRVGLRLTQFQTEFVYGPENGLELRHAVADLAGGKVAADCRLRTEEPGTPYDLTCQMDGIGLGQFIKEAGGKMGLIDGRLQGDIVLRGLSDDPTRCEANGKLELLDTQLRNLPLLQTVGEALRIDDLRHPRFKMARLDYRLAGDIVTIEPLKLVSNDLQITARGNYHLAADRLNLQARLVIDPAISRQLPKVVERLFTPCGDEAPGSRYIDFSVGGPLSRPSSDLYERLLPRTFDSVLDSLFHSKSKRSKAGAPRSQPVPTPAGEADDEP